MAKGIGLSSRAVSEVVAVCLNSTMKREPIIYFEIKQNETNSGKNNV
jgi:hypothetical protein